MKDNNRLLTTPDSNISVDSENIYKLGIPRRIQPKLLTDYGHFGQGNVNNLLIVVSSLNDIPKKLLTEKILEESVYLYLVQIAKISDSSSGVSTSVAKKNKIMSLPVGLEQNVYVYCVGSNQGRNGVYDIVRELAEFSRSNTINNVYIDKDEWIESVIEAIILGGYKWNLLSKNINSNAEAKKFIDSNSLGVSGIEQAGNQGEFSVTKYGNLRVILSDTTSIASEAVWNQQFFQLFARLESIVLTRDLSNLPPNYKTPKLIKNFLDSLAWKNTIVEYLDGASIISEGLHLLNAVSKGSDEEPIVAIFRQRDRVEPVNIAVVGKGVVFDAGGLQIKSDSGMSEMKFDMAGAAAVIGAVYYFDIVGYPDNGFIGAVGFVENLLGGSAFKPSDVYTAHNGLRVEIGHTDAEGRLVLGDLLSFVSKKYEPKKLVSIATLTGACISALGHSYTGIMSKNVDFCLKCQEVLSKSHDKTWMLPIDEEMISAVKSENADIRNISPEMKAGSSMGGAFLTYFVPENSEYIHLDIAGTAFRSKPSSIYPAGGTGVGTDSIIHLAKNI